jgi:hypothetical protein
VTELPHGTQGVDHLAKSDHEQFYVELERRSPKTWEKREFPCFPKATDYITVPERRNRYKNDTFLVTVNRDITHGVIIFWESLLASTLAEHPNRYVPRGELFYFVPYRECLPIELPAVDTRTIAELNLAWKREQWEVYRDGRLCFQGDKPKVLSLGPYSCFAKADNPHVEYIRNRGKAGCAILRLRLLERQPYGMTEDEWKEKVNQAERDLEEGLGLR